MNYPPADETPADEPVATDPVGGNAIMPNDPGARPAPDERFVRLVEDYNEVNRRILCCDDGSEPIGPEMERHLRQRRMVLKDRITRALAGIPH